MRAKFEHKSGLPCILRQKKRDKFETLISKPVFLQKSDVFKICGQMSSLHIDSMYYQQICKKSAILRSLRTSFLMQF